MAILFSKKGKDAKWLESTSFEKEEDLQKYIADNPHSIPLSEYKEAPNLLIICREFPTSHGEYIDHVGIDRDGEIYLIETKLYKNSDKRHAVSQVLDYGSTLASEYHDFNKFIEKGRQWTLKNHNLTLEEEIQKHFELDENGTQELIQKIENIYTSKKLIFIILMDVVDDKIKNFVSFMNDNSKFKIFLIEFKRYINEEFEIIIPNAFGAEIARRTVSGGRKDWDETKYFEDANEKIKNALYLDDLRRLYQLSKDIDGEIVWGTGITRGSFAVYFKKIAPRSWFYVYSDGQLVFNTQMMQDKSETWKYRDEFKEKISKIGLKIKGDYKERSPSFSIEEWSPKVNEFIKALRELVSSKV